MRWNKSSAKKLVHVKVTSHESELEFDISPKSTGKYLFDLVCSTIGLRETWYFGLQSYTVLSNGKVKLSQWLKLDKKIVFQKSYSARTPLCFFFHTKFFPEDIEQELIQATTRHLFYLSVKSTILNRNESTVNGNLSGDLCPSVEVAILLASLAAQAEFGDFGDDDLDAKDDPAFLSNRLLRLVPKQLVHQFQSNQNVAQKLKDCYKAYRGITRDKAELQYLKIAQLYHLFGVDYFPIICVRMKCPRTLSLTRYLSRNELPSWRSWGKHHTNAWLGVTAAGIQLYSKNQREKPRYTFQWNIIKNVSYRERKFTVKLIGSLQRCCKTSVGSTQHPVGSSSAPPPPVVSSESLDKHCNNSRPRQPSRSTGGRSPLMGSSGSGAAKSIVTCGPGGSAVSAASLPGTPLSLRLNLPTVASSGTDCSGLPSSVAAFSSRACRESSCDMVGRQRRRYSPNVMKTPGRTFEFDSGCVLSLLPIAARCSAADLPPNNSGGCLGTQRAQTTDSSGAGSSSSSKASFAIPGHSVTSPVISVVEVWLADPSQAKTVMSMCAGNHALFMRRRQPDSVEVQQMRAQAREERARREVERSRLARARAEKAEAIEAKLVLESRCAQLERALRQQYQHSFCQANVPVDTVSRDSLLPTTEREHEVSDDRLAESSDFPGGHLLDHVLHPENDRLGSENRSSNQPPNDPNSVDYPQAQVKHGIPNLKLLSDIRSTKCVFPSAIKKVSMENEPWSLPDKGPYSQPVELESQYSARPAGMRRCGESSGVRLIGSASTPATPYLKRAFLNQQMSCHFCPNIVAPSLPVLSNDLGHPTYFPTGVCPACDSHPRSSGIGLATSNPCLVGSSSVFHPNFCSCEDPWNHSCKFFRAVSPRTANSHFSALGCPSLYTDFPTDSVGHVDACHFGSELPGTWFNQNPFGSPKFCPAQDPRPCTTTSLSATLSPLTNHRWNHCQAQKYIAGENHICRGRLGDLSRSTCHRSAPFLARSTSHLQLPVCEANHYLISDNSVPLDFPLSGDSCGRGQSLQDLPNPSWISSNASQYCSVHQPPPTTVTCPSRRVASIGGIGWASDNPTTHFPYPEVDNPPGCLRYCPYHNASQVGYLSYCLQEERVKFALLQEQFSQQLCDTWACLRVTRSVGSMKPQDLYSTVLRNPPSNTELRVDPAGASDGASTGCGGAGFGCGASNAYVGLDQLCSVVPSDPEQNLPIGTGWERSESVGEELPTNTLLREQGMELTADDCQPNVNPVPGSLGRDYWLPWTTGVFNLAVDPRTLPHCGEQFCLSRGDPPCLYNKSHV